MKGFFRLPRPFSASPSRWLGEFQRQLRWLTVVDRQAGWVEEFTGLQVHLRPAPLWGHTLEWLTACVSPASDSQPGSPNDVRGRRAKSPAVAEQERALLPDLSNRSGQQRRSPGAVRSDEAQSLSGAEAERLGYRALPHPSVNAGLIRQTASAALALSRQAQIAMLRRLTGVEGVAPGTASPRSPRIRFGDKRGTASAPVSPTMIQNWQERVARRAAGLLSRTQSGAGQMSPDLAPVESWLRTVSGYAAPSDLLHALVNRQAESHRQTEAGGSEGTVEQMAGGRKPARRVRENGSAPTINGGETLGAQMRSAVHHVDTPSAPEAESIRPVSPDVLPPRSTRVLSPLIAPQEPGEPMLPVVRQLMQGAWAEDDSRHEADELSDLALKVKRILEEESRRFGIDV